MSKSKKLTISIILMIVFGILSKSLGLLREIFIAAKFGSGMETDAFFLALAAIGLFTSMFTLSINTSIIPILSEIELSEDRNAKRYHINNILNIIILISIIVSIIAWICSPYIVNIMGAGFSNEQYELAVLLMKIGIPGLIFAVIVGVYRGVLQNSQMFLESSISQFPYNIAFLSYLIFLAGYYGIKGLMVASIIAIGSQLFLQIPSLKKLNYKYEFIIDFKDKYFLKMVYLIGPILISVSINDLNKIVDRALASGLVEGSISALNYSARINSLILAIIITAISTVLFPVLTKNAMHNNKLEFKKIVINGTNVITIIIIPISIVTILLSLPITQLLFERGEYTTKDSFMTSNGLIYYTIGLIGMALRTFYEKAFFALHDTKTPMVNGILTVIFNIVLNLILIEPMEYKGLALATSIASLITVIYLFHSLNKKIGNIGIKEILICLIKVIIASIFVFIFIYYSKITFLNNKMIYVNELLIVTLIIAIASFIYVFVLYVLKTKEIKWFLNLLKQK
ncbi:murein biosynthesis integral membrane protein MurJ [Staphylococcus saprophyticus]|uniref:murein biosynthesis integral membrane protein MurJ n=1 Tax=Staphylococcus saprophyticus TaxID=29385 RepID=UPI00119F5110|nr:murein biosynthesis integral membrane protein MurJ [Staphylococcus saprophyticus]MDW3990617.1 murein biosynthesis integral membrane protein MurJ [Staphylococcus saprophyticus]